nr:PLxRFG domain-containing protein [Caldimonas thermodepolymerans]
MKRLLSDGDTHRFKGLVIAHFTNAIERAEGDEKARLRKTLDTIEQKYERIDQLKAQGYAPLMRFGRYSVTVRDAGGAVEFFGLYESQREANAAARAFRESPEFRASTVQTGVLSELEYQQFSGMSPETLELFAEAAGVEKTEIFQEYLKLAKSNRSALKRLIHRKGIAGYSEDVSRVLASFLTSNARAASGNLHIGEMARATEAIPRSMGDVKDEAIKLTQYVQNPTEEAQRVRGLLFMQFLGGSVASAMVNMTQPFMMTYPYLAQFSGMANAARRLTAAMKEAVAGVSDADLRDALAKAEREGIVSPQELHQLQAEASRSMGNNPFVRRTLFVWGSLFALAEQFNRRVSFIAAYRTAREQGMPDPFGFAADAVDVTQGVYNRGNRPNWARGALGATLFTFKQYSITYMEFLKRLPPKERALALAILVAASGVEGLPFADDLDDLVDTLAQHMGSDFNFKLWRTRQLGAILGEGGADFVLRGTSALPGFPLDVSARLSMANLIPGTGVLLKSRQDKAGEVFDVMGPIGGLAQDVLKGEFRPLAIRNLAKGLEMFQTGEYRDTRGRKVREVDPLDAFIKGLGFQPAEVARESRKITMANQQVQLARAVEGEIAARWAQGIVEGDPEMVAEAREMLQRWNERNPDSRIGITRAQIARRAREMRMGRQERFLKATPKEMRGSVL